MYTVSDKQLEFILSDLSRKGIETKSLQEDLLDHVCIIIEQGLEEGGDFEGFYTTVIKTFYRKQLCEIEEERRLLQAGRGRWVLGRNQFFLLLLVVFVGPLVVYNILCLARSGPLSRNDILLWGSSAVFSLYPLLTIGILYLTPERLDPVIPRGSKILLGLRPLVRIVSYYDKAEVAE